MKNALVHVYIPLLLIDNTPIVYFQFQGLLGIFPHVSFGFSIEIVNCFAKSLKSSFW
jgi:hypothetical protein